MEGEPISDIWQARGNENGILFLVEYFMLKYLNNTLTDIDIRLFKTIVTSLECTDKAGNHIPGLYNRGAGESIEGHEFYEAPSIRRTISHDNITAIASFSSFFDLNQAKDIAKYALKNFFIFDNCHPDSPKFTWFNKSRDQRSWAFKPHPRDWFFWLWCAGGMYRLISWIFFPIFLISNIMECCSNYNVTSGKLLVFTRLGLNYKKSWLLRFNYWICKKILIKAYGENWLKPIVDIYFSSREDHPIRILVKI